MEVIFNRNIRRDFEIAKSFAKIALSRAPIIPVILTPPAIAMMELADYGTANAEESCSFRVELFTGGQASDSTYSAALYGPIPCNSEMLDVHINARNSQITYSDNMFDSIRQLTGRVVSSPIVQGLSWGFIMTGFSMALYGFAMDRRRTRSDT